MQEKSMKKNMKKLSAIVLALCMIVTAIPTYGLITSAADTATAGSKEPVVDTTTGVRYEWHDDISAYRVKTGNYYETVPEKENYVFGGWFTDSADTSDAVTGTTGGAWAKFVPEETLSVKAQINTSLKGVDLTKTDLNAISLRLATSVDSLKYSSVGFEIAMDGNEAVDYPMDEVYKTIKVHDDESNLKDYFVNPSEVFDCAASQRFATLRITMIPNTNQEFTTLDISVTPYWITKDGSKVEGIVRSNLLISDELANYADADNSFNTSNGVSQFTSLDVSTSASYSYYRQASDTVYLAGSYTKAGAGNRFGITIRNGGQTRQVYYDGVGVQIYSNEGITTATATYNTITNSNGVFVWSQSGNANNGEVTKNKSVVSAMLSGNAGTSSVVIWAIEENILYGSVNGDVFLRLPMTALCSDWVDGRYYQVGIASYNTASVSSNMSFTKSNLQFGKAAYGTADVPLIVEETETVTPTNMAYEVITGSYMSASSASGHAYGEAANSNMPIAMSFDLKWQELANSRSGAGIAVKSGNETVQLYLQYDENVDNRLVRRQPGNTWGNSSASAGTVTNYAVTDKITVTKADLFVNEESNVKAAVYDGKLSVLINDITAFESPLNSSDLFGTSYSADNSISLGIATWDSCNGLACFDNLTFYEGQDAVDLKTEKWTFYPGVLSDTDLTFDTKAGTINKVDGRVNDISKIALGTTGMQVWEVTGTMTHEGAGAQGFVVSQVVDAADRSGLYLLGSADAFECRINGVWTTEEGRNIYRFQDGANQYGFRKNTATNSDYFRNSSPTATVNFKAVVANDTIYVWLNDVFSWMVPLNTEEFGGAQTGAEHVLKLAFADSATKQAFTNIKTRTGIEVDTELLTTLKTAKSFNWVTENLNYTMNITADGELIVYNKAYTHGSQVFSTGLSQSIYMSGTYKKVNDASSMFGILISDGTTIKRLNLLNQGIATLDGLWWENYSSYYAYLNNEGYREYVYGQKGISPVATMLNSAKGTEHQVTWAIQNHTLYLSVNGEVALILPLEKICSTWTAANNNSYQIGVGHWESQKNNYVSISDWKTLFGAEADAALKTDNVEGVAENTNMLYDAITGAYVPKYKSGFAGMYGATDTTVAVQADIEWQDMNNTASGAGITVKSGEHSMQVYVEGMNKLVRIQKDQDWKNVSYIVNTNSNINELKNGAVPFNKNGKCQVTAVVDNDTLYIKYNGVLAWKMALNDPTYGIEGYTSGAAVQIGIGTWDAHNGLSLFRNVKLTTGEVIDSQFVVSEVSGTPSIDCMEGTITRTDSTAETLVYFEGTSQTWEMTGTMKQEDLENLVLQGFVVRGREGYNDDGGGYAEAKAIRFYGHGEGFVSSNDWTFPYHSIASTPENKAGAAKYYVFNPDSSNYFEDTNLTNESEADDTLRTATEVDFRLVLSEDILYFWIDDVLSWRIPLTATAFGGYEAGSMYNLGIAIAGDNDEGTVVFENLKVKYGNEANTTGTPKFVVKQSNVDTVDEIAGLIERTDSSKVQSLFFAGADANNRATKWDVSGTIYRKNMTDNTVMGFTVGDGEETVKFFGIYKGFVIVSSTKPWYTGYTSPDNVNADSYVFKPTREDFFGSSKTVSEVDFRALIVDDVLYVYFDDELSWKIPLTAPIFGGFDAGASYEFGVVFNNGDTGTAGFKNLTVKSGNEVLTDADFFIRDPYILTDNETYYLYGSRFGGSFDVLTSKDLITWEKQKPCFVPDEDFWGIKSDYWAPEVHKYTNPDNGETAYYMFATFRGNETTSTRKRGTAILKADSPLGPFKEWSVDSEDENIYGPVTSAGKQCLDGTLYVEDGVPYMIFSYEYTDSAASGIGAMYYVQLSNDLKKVVAEPVKMFDAKEIINSSDVINCYVADGPQVYKASDGTLLLLWSTFTPGETDTDGTANLYLQLQVKSSTGKLVGATWTYDADNSILYGNEENLFDGGHGMVFTDLEGEQHTLLHTPNIYNNSLPWSCRHRILDVTFDADSQWLEVVTRFQTEEVNYANVNTIDGTIASIPSQGPLLTRFAGNSETWEITGKMTRTDDVTAEDWCPGFIVKTGEKALQFEAVRLGMVFPKTDYHERYAYHAFGVTAYNKNTNISKFVFRDGQDRQESEMNFKVVIANDTFYGWFGYEGEEMQLSWVIPLATPLYQTDGTTQIFEGFSSGSKYNLAFYVPATSGEGNYNNLTVKTGTEVDTSFLADITN